MYIYMECPCSFKRNLGVICVYLERCMRKCVRIHIYILQFYLCVPLHAVKRFVCISLLLLSRSRATALRILAGGLFVCVCQRSWPPLSGASWLPRSLPFLPPSPSPCCFLFSLPWVAVAWTGGWPLLDALGRLGSWVLRPEESSSLRVFFFLGSPPQRWSVKLLVKAAGQGIAEQYMSCFPV